MEQSSGQLSSSRLCSCLATPESLRLLGAMERSISTCTASSSEFFDCYPGPTWEQFCKRPGGEATMNHPVPHHPLTGTLERPLITRSYRRTVSCNGTTSFRSLLPHS